MITTPDLKVDISSVSKIPALEKQVDKAEKEVATTYKEWQKKKGDYTLKNDHEDARKELAKQQNGIKAIEAGLAEDYAGAVTLHGKIHDALTEAAKQKDLPASVTEKLKKLTAVNEQTRKKDLTYLDNLKKKGTLHQEPARLKRTAEELNEDKKDFNDFEKTIDAEIDKEYLAKWEDTKKKVAILLEPAGGDNLYIGADKTMDETLKKLRTARWKNYDAVEKKMRENIAATATDSKRRDDIFAMRNDFPNTFRDKIDIINKARNSESTAEETKSQLQAAFDKQRKPSKSQWVQHLGMAGYQLASSDKVGGFGTHLTWDKNAWGPDTNGGIDVSKHKAKAIMDKLFGEVDWTYQIHMTLEAPHKVGQIEKQPHVYYGGHDNHFETARTAYGGDKNWVEKHRSGLKTALKNALAKIEAKIQVAIDKDGAI